ncbi:MAG TPA: hypothetical protein VK002_13565 [Rubricoccaceae bacterium]|jgi:hypothetical protein|nr:hypothetical protein [Rubricoccaceae bacterium]
MLRFSRLIPALLGLLVLAPGCTTLQQLAALRQVDFDLGGVDGGRLAGVDIDRVRTTQQLRPTDLARLTAAAARGEMPLAFTLHVDATNPEDNGVPARLVQLDWTLLVDGAETISGVFNDERLIQPGTTADLPISMRLDLLDFFDESAPELINLALNLAGAGGDPARLALRARPTINTSLGPITYPGYITITHTVGR